VVFDNYFGNRRAQEILELMISGGRMPQTILLDGPEGVGKATLARRFAARLLGGAGRIEQDDLSLPANVDLLAEREKWPSDKRADDPFYLASNPDFVTFAPDGPLRQISIQQIRALKDQAQFGPLSGSRRVFLIDGLDRANEQAANSLLKTLEEPPEYLILLATAENPYDLLPTIRSRSVPIRLARLSATEMKLFADSRGLPDAARRTALAAGSPGVAASLDLEVYDKRREAMRAMIETASAQAPFGRWAGYSERLALARSEKLEPYLKSAFLLLEDMLHLQQGEGEIRNQDLVEPLGKLAAGVNMEWIRAAVHKTDELMNLLRRNIQKNIALDAMVLELRTMAQAARR
jgi:DNA polymerase III subunit delta'